MLFDCESALNFVTCTRLCLVCSSSYAVKYFVAWAMTEWYIGSHGNPVLVGKLQLLTESTNQSDIID